MATLDLDDETYARLRLAARVAGISEAEVVRRALAAVIAAADDPDAGAAGPAPERDPRDPEDPWEPVELYAEYEGRRVLAKYLPATRRLTVATGAVAGQTFKTPSGAARAVVAALNPSRVATQTNGWRFWKIAATHEPLGVLRGDAGAARESARQPRG